MVNNQLTDLTDLTGLSPRHQCGQYMPTTHCRPPLVSVQEGDVVDDSVEYLSVVDGMELDLF